MLFSLSLLPSSSEPGTAEEARRILGVKGIDKVNGQGFGRYVMDAKDIRNVMVIGGAGIMGQGIVQSFAQAGFWVRLVDISEA